VTPALFVLAIIHSLVSSLFDGFDKSHHQRHKPMFFMPASKQLGTGCTRSQHRHTT
jgi:hypothetical protein